MPPPGKTKYVRPSRTRLINATRPPSRNTTAARPRRSELFTQRLERGPARVGRYLVVRVRFAIQVLPAHRAQPGAIRPAEDLVRDRKAESVARPRGEIELVVHDVLRLQLLGLTGTGLLVLARLDRQLNHRLVETPEAGAVEPRREAQLEDGTRARFRDHERGGNLLRHGDVALARELERFQVELDLVAVLLPRPELDRSEVEAPYEVRVALGRCRREPPCAQRPSCGLRRTLRQSRRVL